MGVRSAIITLHWLRRRSGFIHLVVIGEGHGWAQVPVDGAVGLDSAFWNW